MRCKIRNKTQRNVYSNLFILIISVVLWNNELFRHECTFGIVNNTLFISILIKIGMNMRLYILCNKGRCCKYEYERSHFGVKKHTLLNIHVMGFAYSNNVF